MLYDYTSTTAARIAKIASDAMEQADVLVAAAVASSPRTWADTIAPLEEAGTIMGDAYGQSPFMARVHPEKEVRDRATEIDEQLTKWGTDLMFRPDLFAAVNEYSTTEEAAALTGTKARLVEFWLRDFRRAGHELSEADQAELQRLQQRLIELQVEY